MTITINRTSYEFKTNFAELTFAEYLPIMKATKLPALERLQAITGIPPDLLNELPLKHLSAIIEAVKGLEDTNVLSLMATPFEGTHVGLESFGKIETVKRRLKGSNFLDALPEIVKVYTKRDIANEPIKDVWFMALFYLDSVVKFFKRYERLGEHKYSDEELEAGVEVFEGFGHFPTVVKIGRERGLTNDEVLALSAEEVYMELLLDFERSEFEANLGKIHREREAHFNSIPPQ